MNYAVLTLIPILVFAGAVNPEFSGAVSVSGAGTSWSNTSNAAGSTTGDYASVSLTSNGEISEYLEFTDFGISIPSGYQIDGVVVEISFYQDATKIEDNSVYLIKGGVIQTGGDNKGNDNALPAGPPGTTTTYGNSTDTWGVALTEADVEALGFGVALRLDKLGGGGAETGYVDWVRITVYASLTEAGSSPESDREVATGMGSDNGWSPLTNEAGVSDDIYESVTMAKADESQYLIVDNFGFSIPAANTILGIQVSIERSSSGNRTSDFKILLVDESGTVLTGGDDKADTDTDWPTSDGVAGYGGAADLWGQIAGFWTPAKINDPDFGLAIAVLREDAGPAGNRTAQVDHVIITITHEDPVALPIELIFFKAKVSQDKSVSLTWRTASETNNDFFTVERSSDGFTFEDIKRLNGSNNSNQIVNYAFVDNEPIVGISYYRLKQTDFDGQYTNSSLVSVKVEFTSKEAVSIYPNPIKANNLLQLKILNENDASEIVLQILNMKGLIIREPTLKSIDRNGETFFESKLDLQPGIYIGRITLDRQFYTKRIIVE